MTRGLSLRACAHLRQMAIRLIDRAFFPVALHSRDGHQTSHAARVTSTDDPSALHTFDGEVVRAAVA